jgi:hypothetical protein
MEGWPEEKRARCGCGWGARGGLRARAGARSWPVRSEIGRKRAIPIGGEGCQGQGEKQRHCAMRKLFILEGLVSDRELRPNFLGLLLANGFRFSSPPRGTLVSDYCESTLHYHSNIHECGTLIRSKHWRCSIQPKSLDVSILEVGPKYRVHSLADTFGLQTLCSLPGWQSALAKSASL